MRSQPNTWLGMKKVISGRMKLGNAEPVVVAAVVAVSAANWDDEKDLLMLLVIQIKRSGCIAVWSVDAAFAGKGFMNLTKRKEETGSGRRI
ncbi:hypothetical protein ASPWEDRAFT_458554 [Aspergillus wentii DTO 134E9]|uniref:Uncharacterized protein n=1 Tax=Aspergillus wentii DTO 134E9 TaxID=1073089 RepID=A0A1L9RRF1_ASPWE|nr:uncharacterized protein ASPWEDRAFT_458554 [Aspergillus wentii DTO 134E9]OJJ37540.1 hypothetical protein ASPWEDRAFT_458554 [Aspergillus wentii DTO 134E9]